MGFVFQKIFASIKNALTHPPPTLLITTGRTGEWDHGSGVCLPLRPAVPQWGAAGSWALWASACPAAGELHGGGGRVHVCQEHGRHQHRGHRGVPGGVYQRLYYYLVVFMYLVMMYRRAVPILSCLHYPALVSLAFVGSLPLLVRRHPLWRKTGEDGWFIATGTTWNCLCLFVGVIGCSEWVRDKWVAGVMVQNRRKSLSGHMSLGACLMAWQ